MVRAIERTLCLGKNRWPWTPSGFQGFRNFASSPRGVRPGLCFQRNAFIRRLRNPATNPMAAERLCSITASGPAARG